MALAADIARAGAPTIHPDSADIYNDERSRYFSLWFETMSWDCYTATAVDGHISSFNLRYTKLDLAAGKVIAREMRTFLGRVVKNTKKRKDKTDPKIRFTSKVVLAETSKTEYAYVDLLPGQGGLYQLCHELVGIGTNRFGLSPGAKSKRYHASFRMPNAPCVEERKPIL